MNKRSPWRAERPGADTMNLLFDKLGPSGRPPAIAAAIEALSTNDDETARGAIYTRSTVVTTILDLVQYVPEQPLHQMRLLEPSFGGGDFLLPAIERLLAAFARSGHPPSAARTVLRDSTPMLHGALTLCSWGSSLRDLG